MKTKKIFRRVFVAVVASMLITVSHLSVTLAKFTTTISGTGTQAVAVWKFDVNDNTTTSSDTFSITLSADSYSGKVTNGMIAPGVGGSFEIVSTNYSDVSLTYTLSFTVSDKPANVKFYYNNNGTPVELVDDGQGNYYYDFANSSGLTGKLGIGSGTPTYETITIYWAWDYDNATSSQVDNADQGKTMTVNATVTATQDNPAA